MARNERLTQMELTDIANGVQVAIRNYWYDVNALEWVAATGGTAVGSNVNVANFPSTQPVSLAAALVAGTNKIGGTYSVGGQLIDEGAVVRATQFAFVAPMRLLAAPQP